MNPNIVDVTVISGKTALALATTAPTAIVTAASGSIVKVNTILVSNVSASATDVTVDIFRSATQNILAPSLSVPVKSVLTILAKDIAIYLEEGDSLRVSASADNALRITVSYEIIS